MIRGLFVLCWILLAIVGSFGSKNERLPNIFLVLVDDFGWNDAGWHRTEAVDEIQTPTMDALVREGLELDRHYVHMMCTPSRASLQTGRLPVHVLTQLADPCDKNGAIPRNMTGIAAKLKAAGYSTHQVGKWDAGMTTPTHTPQGRGYDTSLNYFSHGNWMYTEAEWLGSEVNQSNVPLPGIIDLWDTDRPARHLNGTGYEEYLFRDRMLKILRNHSQIPEATRPPLFLNYDSKIVHYPLQVPVEYQKKFDFIPDENRRIYHAMVNFLDDQLKNVTDEMRRLGMWDTTLMILSSDNGGYVLDPQGPCNTTTSTTAGSPATDTGHGTVCFNGEAGANNYPLRGGKYAMFEGGIRVNAFVAGGFVPEHMRGSKMTDPVHIADWYTTLCAIAGVDSFDVWANASDLPPVDGLNVWPYLSGQVGKSPRDTILVTKDLLLHNEWKYVRGGAKMIESAWGGPQYPNASTADDPIDAHHITCPSQGCLFNVVDDIREEREISAENPDVVESMRTLLDKEATTIWSTTHERDPACRAAAWSRYGGFFGPWKEVASDEEAARERYDASTPR